MVVYRLKLFFSPFVGCILKKFLLCYVIGASSSAAFADDISSKTESAIRADGLSDFYQSEFMSNDAAEQDAQEEERILKSSYISPYNYIQNPIMTDIGLGTTRNESGATFNVGAGFVAGYNVPMSREKRAINTDVVQIWGQSARYNGFAVGGGASATLNFTQIGQDNVFKGTSVFVPDQAYIDYQYSNKFQATVGAMMINNPWVNSIGNSPGTTFAFGNNTYQAAQVNIQALPSLLVTGFYAWNYLMYPNNWYSKQTLYNVSGDSHYDLPSTNGPSGVGLIWNPTNNYTAQLWAYNFSDYASMAYFDNAYHIPVGDVVSFDLAGQGFMQRSSGANYASQVVFPGQSQTAGDISSNGVGAKFAVNVGNNTSSISYNNIFGAEGSFLNGGMVTPYTYGMETDPLYTTPALNSLAELGSGSAYTIRNSTRFLDNKLKFSLSMSQFFVNQVYSFQPSVISEYDATLLYNLSSQNMMIWTRLVYQDKGAEYGGAMWQPRVNFDWYF